MAEDYVLPSFPHHKKEIGIVRTCNIWAISSEIVKAPRYFIYSSKDDKVLVASFKLNVRNGISVYLFSKLLFLFRRPRYLRFAALHITLADARTRAQTRRHISALLARSRPLTRVARGRLFFASFLSSKRDCSQSTPSGNKSRVM